MPKTLDCMSQLPHLWNSATTISALVVRGVLLITLFIYEAFTQIKYLAIPVLKGSFVRYLGSLVACATVATVSCATSHVRTILL